MIKYLIIVILTIIPIFAEELPYEFKKLKNIRDSQIETINEQYVTALEKLKLKYTKKGELASALLVDEEIKSYLKSDSLSTENIEPKQFLGTWLFSFDNWSRVRTIETNNKVNQSGKFWGTWKTEKQILILTSKDGKQINTFKLPLSKDINTGEYRDQDGRSKLTIKKINK
ncbi:MAG: hypothetical protein ACSHX6_16655 [Akkermansiaceae bacterium]